METNHNERQNSRQENELDETNAAVNEPQTPLYEHFADREEDEEDRKEDEDYDDDNGNETDDDDDDDTAGDWGTVDPLEHPGPPSDMDPSAPGSAV